MSYTVAQETPIGNADLRVCRITTPLGAPANLTQYVSIYTGTNEVGQTTIIGGVGNGNGGPNGSNTGYLWDGTIGTVRFGDNLITGSASSFVASGLPYVSDVLGDTFDPQITGTTHEAAFADHDSGGGWFLSNGSQYQVAGLNAYVTTGGQSLYAPPDQNVAIRLSSYAAQINSIINATPEPGSLSLAGIGAAGLLLCRRRK